MAELFISIHSGVEPFGDPSGHEGLEAHLVAAFAIGPGGVRRASAGLCAAGADVNPNDFLENRTADCHNSNDSSGDSSDSVRYVSMPTLMSPDTTNRIWQSFSVRVRRQTTG
jgi:hypothetical protein